MKYIIVFTLSLFIAQAQAHSPVWTKDIAPILFKHCTSCHNDEGSAPFPLMTYQQAYVNRFSIVYAIKNTMPPWMADPTYRHFKDEKILTADEIHLIEEWARGSAAYGDPKDTPTPPVYENNFKADLEVQIPEYTINSDNDVYRCFPIKVGIDKFITAFHCIPGKYVHHVLIYTDHSDIAFELDKLDPEPGYVNYWGIGSPTEKQIGVWVPGFDPIFYPSGMGQRLEKNIIIQVHYAPRSKGQKDTTKFLAKLGSQSLRELKTEPLINKTDLFLPPGTTTVNSSAVIQKKITMISVFPHMHLWGKSMEVQLDTTKIIRINNWNFHWQRNYEFLKPIIANAGDVLKAKATYETDRIIRYGPSTEDEMFMTYFTFTDYQKGDEGLITKTVERTNEILKVYPNPTSGVLNAKGKLFDLTGKLLKIIDGQTDISDLPNGVYFLNSGDQCTKVIKM